MGAAAEMSKNVGSNKITSHSESTFIIGGTNIFLAFTRKMGSFLPQNHKTHTHNNYHDKLTLSFPRNSLNKSMG